MIDEPTARFLDGYFRKIAVRERVEIVGIAVLKTHVHLVIRTRAWFDLPRLVQAFKGGSSHRASRLPGNKLGLRWASEYSATTVSPRQLGAVLRYLERQPDRHPGEGLRVAAL